MILLYSIIVRSFCKWYLVYAVRSKPFWQTKNPLSTRMNEMNELETPKKSGLFNSKIYLRDKNIETSEFRLGGVERATKVLFFGSLGVRFFFEFRDWSRRLEVRHCGCGRKKTFGRVFLLTNLWFRVGICASNFLFRRCFVHPNRKIPRKLYGSAMNSILKSLLYYIGLFLISRHDFVMEPKNKTPTPSTFD